MSKKAAGDLVTSFWARNALRQMKSGVMKKKTNAPASNARWNIVTGDLVEVTQGRCMGERGKVVAVIRDKNRIVVDNVNMRLRHVMSRQEASDEPKRESVLKPCSIHYSNVALVDPSTDKPTKVTRRFLEDGTKVRVSKTTGHVIPKPELTMRRTERSNIVGEKDTEAEDVFEVTFDAYDEHSAMVYKNN
jgi:large subunit ribosomal protein L24